MAVEAIPKAKYQYPHFVMRLGSVLKLNADTFFDLAQANQDIRMELSAEGDLIIMPPAGGNTGSRNAIW